MMDKDINPPDAFRGETGRFYVPCPEGWATMPRYAVYESVADYDNRSHIPHYLPATEARLDFLEVVKIYPENLKTIPPDAAPWERDEPAEQYQRDTPARSIWHDKFTKPRQRHAA
jgi:hypothetical protein